MDRESAEMYTEALGQSVGGNWKQILVAYRLGVPEAMGMTPKEWVESQLGGYVKLDRQMRKEAVAELTEEGLSTREIGGIIGAHHSTVANDQVVGNPTPFEIASKHVMAIDAGLRSLESIADSLCPEELDSFHIVLEGFQNKVAFLLIQIGERIHG